MNINSLIELNDYSINKDINNYIKKLDKIAVISDGSSLASITSFKLNLMKNENFFDAIELLKQKNIKGFENYKIPSKAIYNIRNYGIDIQRYILTHQIYLLNFDRNDDAIKYINDIFYLSEFYSTEKWEKHFIATILSSTMFDLIKNLKDKENILKNFSKNANFIKLINKMYQSGNTNSSAIYNYLLLIPKNNSYYNAIKTDKEISAEESDITKQNNLKNFALEASYPYLFNNFTSLFKLNLQKEYINKIKQDKLELLIKRYQETKSVQLLAELSKISKEIQQ